MKNVLLVGVLCAFGSLAFAAPKNVQEPVAVVLKDGKGNEVGEINLTGQKKGVKIVMHLKNLAPGIHAFHFHENGSCIAPDFKSAGDHFAPDHKKHGKVQGGPHAGDMDNFEVRPDGTATVEVVNEMVTLEKGKNSLLGPKGTSVVIHDKPDDYKTQPSGGAGDRIACGEIKSPL